eukprot:scaffold688_cov365-Pinguiococcus_pyrenoidosus.AAC.3
MLKILPKGANRCPALGKAFSSSRSSSFLRLRGRRAPWAQLRPSFAVACMSTSTRTRRVFVCKRKLSTRRLIEIPARAARGLSILHHSTPPCFVRPMESRHVALLARGSSLRLRSLPRIDEPTEGPSTTTLQHKEVLPWMH